MLIAFNNHIAASTYKSFLDTMEDKYKKEVVIPPLQNHLVDDDEWIDGEQDLSEDEKKDFSKN
jgi:hypothetical protein